MQLSHANRSSAEISVFFCFFWWVSSDFFVFSCFSGDVFFFVLLRVPEDLRLFFWLGSNPTRSWGPEDREV